MGEGCNVPFEEEWEVGYATGPFTIQNRYVTEDVPVGCMCIMSWAKNSECQRRLSIQ